MNDIIINISINECKNMLQQKLIRYFILDHGYLTRNKGNLNRKRANGNIGI